MASARTSPESPARTLAAAWFSKRRLGRAFAGRVLRRTWWSCRPCRCSRRVGFRRPQLRIRPHPGRPPAGSGRRAGAVEAREHDYDAEYLRSHVAGRTRVHTGGCCQRFSSPCGLSADCGGVAMTSPQVIWGLRLNSRSTARTRAGGDGSAAGQSRACACSRSTQQ